LHFRYTPACRVPPAHTGKKREILTLQNLHAFAIAQRQKVRGIARRRLAQLTAETLR
jgi:hypothetical protein